MASSITLPSLQGHFLGGKTLASNTQKPFFSVPKQRSRSYPTASAKFNLFEILGGRGLCNGEKGIEEELKKSIENQETEASSETVQSSDSQELSVNVPEEGFDKELMGLTGGFPGGEAGLMKFIEENPPPPKKAAQLMPGTTAIVNNPNSPFYMYCGIVQRITDGRAGVLFAGGNWDRLVTFGLEELERRDNAILEPLDPQ